MIDINVKFDVDREVDRVAYNWWSKGFTVIPFNVNSDVKQPLVEWKQWENKCQSPVEFVTLPWDRANGFAVLCGKPNEKGQSVIVVDYDVKKTSKEAQDIGRKVIRYLPTTSRERTISGGEHHIYLSQKPAKTISAYHDSAAVELLGENKLCIMYPSNGYSKINDNLPTEVDDIEALFYEALRKAGVRIISKRRRQTSKRRGPIRIGSLRPCFERLMKKAHLSHDERVALVIEVEHTGMSTDEIKRLFHQHQAWEVNYDPQTTDKQIDSIIGRYERLKRERLMQIGACFEECPLWTFDDCRDVFVENVSGTLSLIFERAVRGARIKALRNGEAITGWITVEKPEKLRTSRSAKILRDLLKEEHPADWGIIQERIIQRIEDFILRRKDQSIQNEEDEKREEDPDVEKEVERIFSSEDPLSEIKKHLDNLIAGEDYNKLTIFLLLLSGKLKDPSLKQMILLKGESGGGKSKLMEIADLYKTKKVGRFTEHAVDYAELRGYEVLKLKEIGLMDEEKQGVSTLKFLSADDEGYTVEYTTRDPETNELVTKTKRIPPITVISSTTRVSIDPQFTRRNWIISPDESEAQTLRVARWIERYERERAEVLLGLRKETSYEFSQKVLRTFLSRLEDYQVIIPFPRAINEILEPSSLRVRGDYKKLLALVKFYVILLQNKLPKIQTEKSKVLIATPDAAIKAINVALEPLTMMTAELDRRTEETLRILMDLKKTRKGDEIIKEDKDEIARRRGVSPKTVHRYLNELENSGYLGSRGTGTKRDPKTWYLIYDIDVIKRKLSKITDVLESPTILYNKMVKEAQEWLNSIRDVTHSKIGYISEENRECDPFIFRF